MPTRRSLAARRDAIDRFLLSETYTMALYVSVVLLASLDAVHETADTLSVMELIWGTTVGLAIVHAFAFTWAGRLVVVSSSRNAGWRPVAAQLIGALCIAVPISVVVWVFPASAERVAARVAVALLIGGLVYADKRISGTPPWRALGLALAALVFALLAALIKNHLGVF